MTDRRWRVCGLVAEHGVLDTAQVAVLVGVSRPTAHRLLDDLHEEGLVARRRLPHGRHHRWLYQATAAGHQAVIRMFPAGPGGGSWRGLRIRVGDLFVRYRVNQFLVDLTAHGRRTPGVGLHRWWHWVEAQRLLRECGVADPFCDGHGIWAEDAVAVSFVLHWYAGAWDMHTGVAYLPAQALAACYDSPASVGVVLVVVDDPGDERTVQDATAATVGTVVATTTPALLAASPAGGAGPVWATAAAVHNPPTILADVRVEGPRDQLAQQRIRLIDLPAYR